MKNCPLQLKWYKRIFLTPRQRRIIKHCQNRRATDIAVVLGVDEDFIHRQVECAVHALSVDGRLSGSESGLRSYLYCMFSRWASEVQEANKQIAELTEMLDARKG